MTCSGEAGGSLWSADYQPIHIFLKCDIPVIKKERKGL